MKHIITLVTTTLIVFTTSAQEITIGQQLPNAPLPRMLYYKAPSASLGDFSGKPLLINFWSTHCTAGIGFIPRLDSLRKASGNAFNVLLVSYEDESQIRKAFVNKTLLQSASIAVSTSDTLLQAYFPHRTAPHLVWVDAAGKVQAITGSNALTASNLKHFVQGAGLKLAVKTETRDNNVFWSATPLMANDFAVHGNKGKAYSYLGGYRQGIIGQRSTAQYNPERNQTRMVITNQNMVGLYKWAFRRFGGFHNTQVVRQGLADSITVPLYCYDIELADSVPGKAYSFMRQDLDRAFECTSTMAKQWLKVWVFKLSPGSSFVGARQSGEKGVEAFEKDGYYVLRNVPFNTKIETWNLTSAFPFAVVNETGIKGRVDLQLAADFTNLSALKASLKPQGLDLVEEMRELEVIVLQKREEKTAAR